MDDKEIKKLHKAKLDRWAASGNSAERGGFMHDAATLVAAGITPKDAKKKLYEMLCVVYEVKEEITTPKPISDAEAEKAEKGFQKIYDKQSNLDDINKEIYEQ